EKLYVTQPILSRCIQNLEQELGGPLIIRGSRAFSLTDTGKVLYEYGRQLIKQHQDIYRRIQDIQSSAEGEVRIVCPGVLLDMYFPKLIAQYQKDYPNIRIAIHERESRPTASIVLNGDADLGLVMLPVDNQSDLNVYPIITDEVQVVVPEAHPFAKRAFIPIEDLRDVSIITYNSNATLHKTFLQMCKERGFVPNLVCQSLMPNFILATISYGRCVGVIPAPMCKQFQAEGLVSVPIEPRFPWVIALITKKNHYLSHAAQSFLFFAQRYFKEIDIT
ncbi:MAG: LysR family transcriptional regulator, partial [Lachnospiraceae bacterium]|nr:LysR family transcriptional regulator [Lachnospiraceae bacterium]